MKLRYRIAVLFLFAVCEPTSACFSFQKAETTDAGAGSPLEKQAQQEILTSPRWTKAKQQFDEWLSVQTAYNKAEVEVLKSELRNRIESMSAQELISFLEEMETKIVILMNPATTDARRWVAAYTDKAQQKIRKKFGVDDPLSLSADEIGAVLQQFSAERQSRLAASAAFNRARDSQARAIKNYKQTQSRAARTASSHRPPSRSSYAPRNTPRRPQTYSAPYHKTNYSVGPWGGVWVSPGRR